MVDSQVGRLAAGVCFDDVLVAGRLDPQYPHSTTIRCYACYRTHSKFPPNLVQL